MSDAIYPLFACPIMVCARHHVFSQREREVLDGLPMVENIGNSMSRDDQVLDRPELAALRQFVETHVQVYCRKLFHIARHTEIRITQSWVNRTAPGQFHARHAHPNSIVSGVLFLDEAAEGELPPICFHRGASPFPLDLPYEALNEFNASAREFDAACGRLILFPSRIEHEVGVNRSPRNRSSLSFNTFLRGDIGNRASLTAVTLA